MVIVSNTEFQNSVLFCFLIQVDLKANVLFDKHSETANWSFVQINNLINTLQVSSMQPSAWEKYLHRYSRCFVCFSVAI